MCIRDRKKGDVITEINGKKIHIYEEFQLYNLTHSTSDTAELTFERDGKEYTIQMEKRQFGDETTKRMGFTYSAEVEKPGFFKSIQYGAYTAKYWVEYTLECLKMLLTGEVGVNQLSGPVAVSYTHLTDDFRQRDSAGGRGSIRAPFSELETSAAGKICRRIFMYAGRAFAWKLSLIHI